MHLLCDIIFKGKVYVSHMLFSFFSYSKHFWPAVHFKDISRELIQIINLKDLPTERARSVPKGSWFHHLNSEICIFPI